MEFETLDVSVIGKCMKIVFNRPSARNSINTQLLEELNWCLDYGENDPNLRVIIIEGKNGFFCTGVDFLHVGDVHDKELNDKTLTTKYMTTLKRFSSIPLLVVSNIDGQVMAGGIGIVAASDLAVATRRSVFSLSEALWGLVPSMVMPYLIRKVGYQKAKIMTLSTIPVEGEEAYEINLLDHVCEDESLCNKWIQNYTGRTQKLEKSTIANTKDYLNYLTPITQEIEQYAINKTSALFCDEKVLNNINNYVKYKVFPWESIRGE